MTRFEFLKAQQRYSDVREAAYTRARDRLVASREVEVPLRLAGCNADTLAVWRATWTGPHPSGWGGWDWDALLRQAWKHPSAFHLAIWSGDVLCGLADGRTSRSRRGSASSAISIHHIESAHDAYHPLRGKIASLVTAGADAYGRSLGARWIRLVDPFPGVLDLYANLGFAVVSGKTRVLYCERRIEP